MAEGVDDAEAGKKPLPSETVKRVVHLALGPPREKRPIGQAPAGDGRRDQPAFGAAHPGRASACIPPRSDLQVVEGL
jgi:hypothetical protein